MSHSEMSRLLPDDKPHSIAIALGLGAASSSCSYAAVALARSVFRKGGDFTAAMAFELASTTLVLELSIIMIVLLGWQFALAEFVGAPIMVVILIVLFRTFLERRLVGEAKEQADRGIAGRMEGHAEMDMSVTEGPLRRRVMSQGGFTAISHYFVMDWASVWLDIAGGLLIAGALAAWVPSEFWQAFFFVNHPVLAKIWGPLIGPAVAIISFVCSVGNIPLAAVLSNGGISFGGVIAFIFADLIVLPVLDIYRRHYGIRMMGFLLITLYVSMAAAALIVDTVFGSLGLVPQQRQAYVVEAAISWNYTTWLNIAFLIVAALLVWRFLRTGGPEMLRTMGYSNATATTKGETKTVGHVINESTFLSRGDTNGISRGAATLESLEPLYQALPTAVHGLENLRYLAGQLIRNLPTGQAVISFIGQNGIESYPLKVPNIEASAAPAREFDALRERVLRESPSVSIIEEARVHVARRRALLIAEAHQTVPAPCEPAAPEGYRVKKRRSKRGPLKR